MNVSMHSTGKGAHTPESLPSKGAGVSANSSTLRDTLQSSKLGFAVQMQMWKLYWRTRGYALLFQRIFLFFFTSHHAGYQPVAPQTHISSHGAVLRTVHTRAEKNMKSHLPLQGRF